MQGDNRIEELRRRHCAWLSKISLADRPWLVLAAAPNPTLPEPKPASMALVCINNSVLTASQLGLGAPDMALRTQRKIWDPLLGLEIPNLMWLHRGSALKVWFKARFQSPVKIGNYIRMTAGEREIITDYMLGQSIAKMGDKGKLSMGVFGALYGLFCGAPQVVLSGVSLQNTGYSYTDQPMNRWHLEEDRFALEHLAANHPQLFTSEPELHELIGMPMYKTSV